VIFDIGFGEMVLIAAVGLVVLGPERLPRYAAQAARLVRQLREQIGQARSTIVQAAAVDETTLRDLRDLDPRRILDGTADSPSVALTPPTEAAIKSATVPLDPDTT